MKTTLLFTSLLLCNMLNAQTVILNAQIYDYDPGDVFQTTYNNYSIPPIIRTDSVMSKTISTNALIYHVMREVFQYSMVMGQPPTHTFTELDLTYIDLDDTCSVVPDSWYCGGGDMIIRDTTFNLVVGNCNLNACGIYPYFPNDCFEAAYGIKYLVEGCGGPYSTFSDGGSGDISDFTLDYFHKEDMECGDRFVVGIEEFGKSVSHLIYNPISNSITATGTETPMEIAIYDLSGKRIESVSNQKNVLSINLSEGIYIVMARYQNANTLSMKFCYSEN